MKTFQADPIPDADHVSDISIPDHSGDTGVPDAGFDIRSILGQSCKPGDETICPPELREISHNKGDITFDFLVVLFALELRRRGSWEWDDNSPLGLRLKR
jgi:hypothetical protein